MSKKVLKYAGRRPMLLALIMATLTLGLLFSGWLTPTPGKAQQGPLNPPPNVENTNTNCPNYTTNVVVSFPGITNGEVLVPLSFCVPLGNPLPDPTWASQPGATLGSVVTTITETCSNVVTSTTNSISYSFAWSYQNPPGKPPIPTSAGVYSATAIGAITSSDTNHCPNPTAPTWTVMWNVVFPDTSDPSAVYNWTPDWFMNFNSMATNLITLPVTISSITGTDNNFYEAYCCSNNSASVSYDYKQVNSGPLQVNIDIGSTPIVDLVLTPLDNLLGDLGLAVLGSPLAASVDAYVTANGIFSAGDLKANVSANFQTVNSYNDTCNCSSGSANAWLWNDSFSFNNTIGSVSIPPNTFPGINVGISITGLSASLSFDKIGSIYYIGPTTTQYGNGVSTSSLLKNV